MEITCATLALRMRKMMRISSSLIKTQSIDRNKGDDDVDCETLTKHNNLSRTFIVHMYIPIRLGFRIGVD